MYSIKTESYFDSAHFLQLHRGKCRNIHGHRWKVEVEIFSRNLNDEGMIVDFSKFKSELEEITDYYDHSLIIEEQSLDAKILDLLMVNGFRIIQLKFAPTAENLAKHFFDLLIKKNYNVKRVIIYETPKNSASYEVFL